MGKTSRLFLLGALILVLLTAACGADEGATPILVGTSFPPEDGDLTSTPLGGTADTTQIAGTDTGDSETPTAATDGAATQAAAAAGTTQTPGIPVTGADIVLVECQFCVDTIAHALLVLPDTATFEVVSPATTDNATNCSTVEVNDGRQVVLCSGPELTPITLKICPNDGTCTDFPVDLLACPLTRTNNTAPGTDISTTTPGGIAISTATSSTIVDTPTP